MNTYYGITNEISGFRCQYLQWEQETPFWNINVLHGLVRSSSFMFPLLLLTVKFKTLLVIRNYFDHKLAKFEQNQMILTEQNLDLFDKNL